MWNFNSLLLSIYYLNSKQEEAAEKPEESEEENGEENEEVCFLFALFYWLIKNFWIVVWLLA